VSLERKLEMLLARKTIHEELVTADRILNILTSRTFYGDLDSSNRTLGGLYGEVGLSSYRASPAILSELAAKSNEGETEAAVVAALVEAFNIGVPHVIYDRFSKEFWESLSRIRERKKDGDTFSDIIAAALSIPPRSARRVLSANWGWIKDVLGKLGEKADEDGEDE